MLRKVLGRRARPTGVTAANLLGLSTQVAAQPEFAAYAGARPRGLDSARLHLRPYRGGPELEPVDAALLEFLRDRGRHGELEAEETFRRLRSILAGASSTGLRRLREAALVEPPRVRAILGALMETAERPPSLWKPLRNSLNPLSRFDFGLFHELPNAREWQSR
jgi:hypothetical protein